jgi:CxxC motif-containing protein (DUF1111 family)
VVEVFAGWVALGSRLLSQQLNGPGALLQPFLSEETSQMRTRVCLAMLAGLSAQVESSAAPVGSEAFTTLHKPPSYRLLDATESEQVSQGQSVFDTQWVPAGTRDAARREGLGPLFNAASCDACHIDGARGQGPIGEGPAPVALVIQLQSPSAGVGPESIGAPVYGRVFNTAALDGVRVEGAVTIRYREVEGYYYPTAFDGVCECRTTN